ncbi:MAG TPA: hypothetical protein VLF89_10140 [Candidatus Saccharimonadales bacterium]|nr:hypothetical protein [Candidatus Saccharimonadales bacterium]
MNKKIFIPFIICFELLSQFLWKACSNFKFITPFSFSDLALQLDDVIHNDEGVPFVIIRFFHNKLTLGVSDLIKKYILLWDFRLIIDLVSILGLVGILFAFWYILQEKRNTIKFSFTAIVLLPIVIVLFPNASYMFSRVVLTGVFLIISAYGWWNFLQKKNTRVVVLTLLGTVIIAVLYYVTALGTTAYFCAK